MKLFVTILRIENLKYISQYTDFHVVGNLD